MPGEIVYGGPAGRRSDDGSAESAPHAELTALTALARVSSQPLSPISDDVPDEVRDFTETLRVLFGALDMSVNRLAASMHCDPGSVSRYLGGKRIPPPDFIEGLYKLLYEYKGSLVTPQVEELLHGQLLVALRVHQPHRYHVQRLTDLLQAAVQEKRQYDMTVTALEEAIASRKDKIYELEREGRQVRSAWARAEALLEEERQQRERLQEAIDALATEVLYLKERLTAAQRQAAEAEQRCRGLEARLDSAGAFLPDEDQWTRALPLGDGSDNEASGPAGPEPPVARRRIESRVTRIGRRPDNDIVVSDFSASMRHAELRQSGENQYQVIDLGSQNGTFVNGARVNEAELNADDIIAIGHAVFRMGDGEVIEYADTGRATFEAIGLQVTADEDSKKKVLLDGITFALPGRSMMAVIGLADSGKSVVLSTLSGTVPAEAGSVSYGFRDQPDELQQRVGLIPQEALAHDQLTARTALGYAAELRFPRDVTATERDHRVGEVLDELGITQHADTRIGHLPGNQRKLVSVGVELLTRPSVLVLDEPTTLLDPHLKVHLFEQLRKMADPAVPDGRSLIVITRDIEPRLMHICDRVLVLAPGGTMAFYGPPSAGLRYFQAEDWADVLIQFRTRPAHDWAQQFRGSPEYMKYVATPLTARPRRSVPRDRQRGGAASARRRRRDLPAQLLAMTRRYLRVMVTDRTFRITVLVPLLLGAVARAVPARYGLLNSTPPGLNINAIQVLTILVMSLTLSGTALSIREFIKERDIYQRERMAGVAAAAYLFSKVIVLSAISVLQAALVVLIGLSGAKAPPNGVVIPGTPLFEIFVALSVLAVTSVLLGLAISALVTRSDQTLPILVGVFVYELALCGGLFPLSGKALEILSSIAPARWGLGALASTINLNALQASEYTPGPNGQKPDVLWTHDAAHWVTSVCVMLIIGVICILAAWLRLRSVRPKSNQKSPQSRGFLHSRGRIRTPDRGVLRQECIPVSFGLLSLPVGSILRHGRESRR
jgi:ABC-type multidrug transport system ATPase subunit/ABC-type multidrug transport system permease subunit